MGFVLAIPLANVITAASRATFSNIHRICPQHTTHRSTLLCCLWITVSWLPVAFWARTVGADHQLLSLLRRDTTLWLLSVPAGQLEAAKTGIPRFIAFPKIPLPQAVATVSL